MFFLDSTVNMKPENFLRLKLNEQGIKVLNCWKALHGMDLFSAFLVYLKTIYHSFKVLQATVSKALYSRCYKQKQQNMLN